MLTKLASLAGFLAFPFLCLHCIGSHSGQIQGLVQSVVSSSLAAAPIDGVNVKADGRDVMLTGHVASEDLKSKAGLLALQAPGVRTVDNQLLVVIDAKAAQVQLDKVLLDQKIDFEVASDVLLPASIPTLEQVVQVLRQAPQLSVKIEGHTDSQGEAKANRVLSERRAQAVVAWLGQHGVSRERMSAAGFGPDKPLATNETAEGRAQNRRVAINAY